MYAQVSHPGYEGGAGHAPQPAPFEALPQRDVVDAEAGREAEVGRPPELDADRLAAPAREAERLLRVVPGRRRVGVGVRAQRREQRAGRVSYFDVHVVVRRAARLLRRDVAPDSELGR